MLRACTASILLVAAAERDTVHLFVPIARPGALALGGEDAARQTLRREAALIPPHTDQRWRGAPSTRRCTHRAVYAAFTLLAASAVVSLATQEPLSSEAQRLRRYSVATGRKRVANLRASAPMPNFSPTEGVRNFRRVSPRLPGLFRSGGLESMTENDAAFLLDRAKIRTIIDLRNSDEIEKAASEATPVSALFRAAYDSGAPVGPGRLASEGSGVLRRIHVPLYEDVDGFFDEIEKRLSPGKKAEALMYKAFNTEKYNKVLYDEVSRGKQQLLYSAMLKSNAAVWGRALALAADRREGAVLIHCAKGKDRTGVLSALLQHAAGDDLEDIADAYAASEALLAEDTAAPAADKNAGVDWSALRGSPPEAILRTFDWIKEEYTVIDLFLESIDCGNDWRNILLQR